MHWLCLLVIAIHQLQVSRALQDFILSTDAAEDHPLFVNKAIDSAPARSKWSCVRQSLVL